MILQTRDYHLIPHFVLIAIITILAIIDQNLESSFYFYLVADIGIIYVLYQNLIKEDIKIVEFNSKRANWISQLVQGLIPTRDGHFSHFIQSTLQVVPVKNLGRNELGFPVPKPNKIFNSPDIEASETELVRLEERATLLIAAVIFLPVLFALIHIFRYVPLTIFVIELQMTIILAQMLSVSQQNNYKVTGWTDVYTFLDSISQSFEVSGKRDFVNNLKFIKNPFANELGFESELVTSEHSLHSSSKFLSAAVSLPNHLRMPALSKYQSEIYPLPKQEQLLNIRWEAYKMRVLFITTIGSAISALLAALSLFDFSGSEERFIIFTSTPNLPITMLLLFLAIAYIVVRSWLSNRLLFRWMLTWGFTYYLVFMMANALFV